MSFTITAANIGPILLFILLFGAAIYLSFWKHDCEEEDLQTQAYDELSYRDTVNTIQYNPRELDLTYLFMIFKSLKSLLHQHGLVTTFTLITTSGNTSDKNNIKIYSVNMLSDNSGTLTVTPLIDTVTTNKYLNYFSEITDPRNSYEIAKNRTKSLHKHIIEGSSNNGIYVLTTSKKPSSDDKSFYENYINPIVFVTIKEPQNSPSNDDENKIPDYIVRSEQIGC